MNCASASYIDMGRRKGWPQASKRARHDGIEIHALAVQALAAGKGLQFRRQIDAALGGAHDVIDSHGMLVRALRRMTQKRQLPVTAVKMLLSSCATVPAELNKGRHFFGRFSHAAV